MPGDAPVSFILPRLSNLLYAFLLIPLSICGWLLWNALIWFPYTAATAKLPGPKRPSWVKGHAEAMFADPRGSGWCYKEWMEQFGGVYRIAREYSSCKAAFLKTSRSAFGHGSVKKTPSLIPALTWNFRSIEWSSAIQLL